MFLSKKYRNIILFVVLALMLSFSVMPSFASLELNIDVQPLFDNIETYLPIFFVILSIGGGITIAVALVKMIIRTIVDAFS